MTEIIFGGVLGLWLGIAACSCGMADPSAMRQGMSLRRSDLRRRVMLAMGWATVLTAFFSWLAVIDVDMLTVLPLHGGTLLGGVIFGAAAGLSGMLPGSAPVVMGGGKFLDGLSGVAGCAAGALLLPWLQPVIMRIRQAGPWVPGTLFRVTLDQPFLLPGGFLAQGCLGAALIAFALLQPGETLPEIAPLPETLPPPEEALSTEAEDVHADTVIALLPGEETVVVDAALPAETEEETVEEIETDESGEEDSLG